MGNGFFRFGKLNKDPETVILSISPQGYKSQNTMEKKQMYTNQYYNI